MIDETKLQATPDAQGLPATPALTQAAPDEPFACPNCGQLLGPACRVCVACRQPVDFAKVAAPPKEEVPFAPARQSAAPSGTGASRGQFSWPIFGLSVLVYVVIVVAAGSLLSANSFTGFLVGLFTACTVWVIYDAFARRVPHPFRWGLGTFLIWIVVFPWYLSRRRTPEVPCTIMDAPGRSFVWTVIYVFILCIIVYSLYTAVLHKPPL